MSEKHDVSETLEDKGRRKAVKTIVSGVTALAAYNVLPARWDTPIIESVFLPAHAQTSGSVITLNDPCALSLVSGNQNTPEAKVKVEGYVTPATAKLPVTITATPEGGTGGPVTLNTTTDAEGKFSGALTVTGGPGLTRINVQTHVEGSANDAVCALDLGKNTSKNTDDGPSEEEPPPQYSITVSSTNSLEDTCGSSGETVSISGTVAASNGADMEGVEINILYTDDPPDGDYASRVVTVQAGNIFSWSGFMTPDVGRWNWYNYRIVVTFVDQATYGTASATTTGSCQNNEVPPPPMTLSRTMRRPSNQYNN